MKTTTELEDIKIDLQDIEGFLENLDKRLTQIEGKLTQENGLTDHDKSLITRFTQDCLEEGLSFTVKDILLLLSQNQNDNSLQRKIACYLRKQGWYKVRRTVNDKKQYIWLKDNER